VVRERNTSVSMSLSSRDWYGGRAVGSVSITSMIAGRTPAAGVMSGTGSAVCAVGDTAACVTAVGAGATVGSTGGAGVLADVLAAASATR
jgi:hypothetical protein